MIAPFVFASTPQLVFGPGKISVLPNLVESFGSRVLLVTGAQSFIESKSGIVLQEQLKAKGLFINHVVIPGEPTPKMVDNAVVTFAAFNADVVVAIGGGSAMDAGKAISALLPLQESVRVYLEGVGVKTHPGIKVPFIAVPTTAGTGSEATKNAVISEVGPHGFKKSLRHNKLVPDIALIDPALSLSCGRETTAASGMDAFTQLLESYLSTAANPVTDALARQGLRLISNSLLKAFHDGSDLSARTDMALAAYLSGITLANAGLGLVHGFAASVGGYFDIPHGVICSSTMAAANQVTVRKLRALKENSALEKYADIGRLFARVEGRSAEYYIDFLLNTIAHYTSELRIPRLAVGGVTRADEERIVLATDNKNNPVALEKAEIQEVLELSL